jgi:VanZ family protein
VIRWLGLWGPAVGLMAAIFAASSVPNLDTSASGVSDKTIHLWTYAALGGLLLRAVAGAAWAGVTVARAGGAWLLAAGWGILDELHQARVPGRFASGADWLADAAGAALAVGVLLGAGRWRRRRRASRAV